MSEIIEIDGIQKEIIDMLTANTGKALCDSGDAYGRNYEKNQKVTNWDERPAWKMETYYRESDNNTEINVTVDLYHYLMNYLEISSIHELNELSEDLLLTVAHSMISFDSDMQNTYNYSAPLSQVIQFKTGVVNLPKETIPEFDYVNNESMVLLSVHGGCDIRGGYTKYKLFALNDEGFGFPNVTIEYNGEEFNSSEGYFSLPGNVKAEEVKVLWHL